jgi:hypothetical protein
MPVASGSRGVVVLALLFVGCQQVPVAQGPRISVPSAAGSAGVAGIQQAAFFENVAAPASVAVELVDRRPDWEREFRSPAVKPSQFEHAIGFVPLENLDPPGELERVVQRVVTRSGLPARSARVELRSFRVVVHDVAALRHDHGVLKRVGNGGGLKIGPFDVGFGMAISSDPIEPGQFGDPIAQQRGSFRPVLLRDDQRYLFGPPTKLPEQLYEAGVTCEIDATVSFLGPHGTEQVLLARVRRHTPPADVTATATTDDLVRTVAAAYGDVETRLVARLALDR